MSKTIEQLIGYENHLGLIESPAGGVPDDILPSKFTTLTKPVQGNYSKWNVTANTRQTATLNAYGAPSRARDKQALSQRSSVLLHTFEHMHHDVSTLMALREFDNPALQALGAAEIDRQTLEFKRLMTNLRISATYSALAWGNLYFKANGDLLPNSTGADSTFDLGISSAHKNQLGGLVTVPWDNVAADIIGDVARVCAQSRKDTGLPIKYAFYGSAVPGFIASNTAVSKLLPGNQQLATSLMAGEIPQGFGTPSATLSGKQGITWIPIYEAFFNDYSGTNQNIFPDDMVVFAPEPDPSWWCIQEGSYAVPTSLTVPETASDLLRNLKVVQGMFSYAMLEYNPVGIKHMMGDTFLPTFLRDAVFQLRTDF